MKNDDSRFYLNSCFYGTVCGKDFGHLEVNVEDRRYKTGSISKGFHVTPAIDHKNEILISNFVYYFNFFDILLANHCVQSSFPKKKIVLPVFPVCTSSIILCSAINFEGYTNSHKEYKQK